MYSILTRELIKEFGIKGKLFKVDMLYTKEMGVFIKKIEAAQRAAKNSNLKFK
jgi:hypothetical protein